MARIPPPPDPTLPASTTKCRCGCGRFTHTYRDFRGSIKETKYTHTCYLRRIDRRTGRPPGRPSLPAHQKRSARVVIRLTTGELQRLKDIAANPDYNTSVAALITKLLDKTLLTQSRVQDDAEAGAAKLRSILEKRCT
jgi:hypothetical protein